MQSILVLQIVKLLCELRQAFTCSWHWDVILWFCWYQDLPLYNNRNYWQKFWLVCFCLVFLDTACGTGLSMLCHIMWMCHWQHVWEASIDLFVLNRYAVYFIGPVYCGSEKLAQNSHVRPVWHISAQLLSLVRLSNWWLQNQTSLFLLHKMLNIGLLPTSRVIENSAWLKWEMAAWLVSVIWFDIIYHVFLFILLPILIYNQMITHQWRFCS